MPTKEKKIVHARITRPVLVRKTLLECAILTTEILKSHQNIKKIRTQKTRLKIQVKKEIQMLKILTQKLEESELPRPPELTKEKPKTPKNIKKELKEEVHKRKLQENLEIDSELENLQRKLKSI